MLLTNCYAGDYIEKNEMGRAHSAYMRQERFIQGLVGIPEGMRPFGKHWHRWGIILKCETGEVHTGFGRDT